MRMKTVWNAGFAVLLAGSAFAVERDRGASGIVAGDAQAAKAAIEFRQVGPGEAVATINGKEMKAYANGRVMLDEIMAEHGSVERFAFERSDRNATKEVNPHTGSMMRADGTVGFFRGIAPAAAPKPPATTVAELKEDHVWVEREFDGVKVVAFANGVVINHGTELQRSPEWAKARTTVANAVSPRDNKRHYATGAVFANEPDVAPEPK